MSVRARHARKLASLLKRDAHLSWVTVSYRQEHRCYVVHWEGGPTAERMYELAAAHADEIRELSVGSLAWLRTEPTPNPYGRRRST